MTTNQTTGKEKKIEDGGPAFPHLHDETIAGRDRGMSLRQWYAGLAMQGLLASGAAINGKRDLKPEDFTPVAFAFADSMLAASKQRGASEQ